MRDHRLTLLAAAAAALLVPAADAHAQAAGAWRPAPSFFCTFTSAPSDCGFYEQAKAPGRARLVTPGRERGYGVRLRTLPGDSNVYGSGRAERNDLSLNEKETDCAQGREAWWAHSVLFPDDYVAPPPDGWGAVFDFHHSGTTGQANFNVDALASGLRLRGYGGPRVNGGHYEAEVGPVQRNVWYDFVYHVRWSAGPDGWFKAWVNGVKKLDHRGPTLYTGQGCYLKLANYHSAFGRPSSVIHDRIVRGSSPEAVALTPLEGLAPLYVDRR